MPETFKVLVLNASLKHSVKPSNTQEVADMVVEEMKLLAPLTIDVVRLSDKIIPPGLGTKESEDDEWPAIVEQIKGAHIVLFVTPIWWGGQSSLMQRAIERMDAFDEEAHGGRKTLLNKVAGIVVTGSEDGAQNVIAHLMSTLSFMNFTLPPQAAAYWVGEVGEDTSTDAERRRKNKATQAMAKATAQNLIAVAKLLSAAPLK